MLFAFFGALTRAAGLPRRRFAPPRNDAEALRELVSSIVKQPDADVRHRPVFTSATGQAVIPVPCSTKERAERIGEKPLSRPLASQASIPHPLEKDNGTRAVAQLRRAKIATTEPGPRKQSFRLRSARGWICRPAGCPRVKSLCPRSPFVRTVARTCTRAVRSCCRGLVGNLCGPPRPVPRREDHRGALRIGTGRLE